MMNLDSQVRDIEGKYLSKDTIEAIKSFLLEKGCSTINGIPNINTIHLTKGFYKVEFSEPNKTTLSFLDISESWVKSFIRDKKIDKLIE